MIRRVLTTIAAAFVSTERIPRARAGEEHVFEGQTNVLMGCCDCGLMHRYDFDLRPDGRLAVLARRDEVATAAIRRDRAFRFTASSDAHFGRTAAEGI